MPEGLPSRVGEAYVRLQGGGDWEETRSTIVPHPANWSWPATWYNVHMTIKTVATNRKAFRDYEILDRFETGIVLTGTEIKSLRSGRANLRDSYATVRNGEVWMINAHISPYTHGNRENHEPRRERKLLLHRKEISRLVGKVQEKGWTMVPLRIYLKGPRAKVELALVRGKRLYDKRREIAKRDFDREVQRAVKDWDLGR